MTLPELLIALALEPNLRFLLIGGHAVIAHGYARSTFDIDLLVRKSQRSTWIEVLTRSHYRVVHEAPSFIQFTPPDGENLDLMLVNDPTFDGLWAEAVERTIGGYVVKMPSLNHLISLKLHVLKQDLGHQVIKDLEFDLSDSLEARLKEKRCEAEFIL